MSRPGVLKARYLVEHLERAGGRYPTSVELVETGDGAIPAPVSPPGLPESEPVIAETPKPEAVTSEPPRPETQVVETAPVAAIELVGWGIVISLSVYGIWRGRKRLQAVKDKLSHIRSQLQSIASSDIAARVVGRVDETEAALMLGIEAVGFVPQVGYSRRRGEYFPITQRQLKQSWRQFRRRVRLAAPTELDVSGTIERISCDGMLLEPVLQPRRTNIAELLLLVDREGSMVAFQGLGDRLVETARRGGNLGKFEVRYFKNCPTETVYRDVYRVEGEKISQVLDSFDRQVSVLIFSDAGAARGAYNDDRCQETRHFLERIRDRVSRVVWLNPLPRSRWENTTAQAIAEFVPMVELSYSGFQQAIDLLRGRQ